MDWYYVIGQTAQQADKPAGGGAQAMMQMVILFGGIFVIFYFLLIRPQRKQEKQRQEMLKQLKKSDKVVTIGGICGVVTNVRDKDVTVKIDESKDVRVRFTRSAVSQVVAKEEEAEEARG